MENQETKKQESHTQKTLWDFARESDSTFDELDETHKKQVEKLESSKDNRDTLAEFRADQMFAIAAKVCTDFLHHEEPEVQMMAVKEVFKLRAVTLRANKKQKTEEKKLQAAHDGFVFASGK